MTTEFSKESLKQQEKQSGNLGQKDAEKEKERQSDLSHMGEKSREKDEQQQKR